MKGTIKSKDQITLLFDNGQKFSAASMLAIYLSTNQSGRLAFIAGKKLGAAPLRSRAKRRLREAAALQAAPWDGYDVVFVARKGAIQNDFKEIEADIKRLKEKLLSSKTPKHGSACLRVTAQQQRAPYAVILSFIHDIPKNIALGCITIYRHAISPLFPPSCRYIPTCSEYALEAIRIHGFIRGSALAARRVGRCHPWHDGGYDPVPGVKHVH
jgi:putative membrane protein insertion efficiency factor/ribonuclease P protein component